MDRKLARKLVAGDIILLDSGFHAVVEMASADNDHVYLYLERVGLVTCDPQEEVFCDGR